MNLSALVVVKRIKSRNQTGPFAGREGELSRT